MQFTLVFYDLVHKNQNLKWSRAVQQLSIPVGIDAPSTSCAHNPPTYSFSFRECLFPHTVITPTWVCPSSSSFNHNVSWFLDRLKNNSCFPLGIKYHLVYFFPFRKKLNLIVVKITQNSQTFIGVNWKSLLLLKASNTHSCT